MRGGWGELFFRMAGFVAGGAEYFLRGDEEFGAVGAMGVVAGGAFSEAVEDVVMCELDFDFVVAGFAGGGDFGEAEDAG